MLALIFHRVQPAALIWIFLSGSALWITTKKSLSKWVRWSGTGIFLLVAIAMFNHILPGFNNLIVFDKINFSADSAPFTMYLNFDKTVVGIFIYLFLLKEQEPVLWRKSDLVITIKVFTILVACLLPIALITHDVRVDPKFPPETWLWILNNLFFVCFAEETLFRGFIQGGLVKWTSNLRKMKWFSLAASSFLFGLAHYKGGIFYILFASLAGLFYGFAYLKTNRVGSSILVHFGLNFIHFLFFSYPWMTVAQ
jgi:membrane protease YdiL (CAAX protease family)